MYLLQSKKLLPIVIMEILMKNTDETHTLVQKDISDILREQYGMKIDRKTLTRTLKELIDYFEDGDYRIGYGSEVRMVPVYGKDKKFVTSLDTGKRVMQEQEVFTNFYLDRSIADSELRLIIDSLLFSMNISYRHRKDLLKKISRLSSKYFESRVRYIDCIIDEKNYNMSFFCNIDIIDEAIRHYNKISFNYMEYGIDKKLHNMKDDCGSNLEYIVNPYQMVVKNEKYYLICNKDEHDDICNYRIDRMKNINILNENIKTFEKLTRSNSRKLNLYEYMKKISICIRVKMYLLNSELLRQR